MSLTGAHSPSPGRRRDSAFEGLWHAGWAAAALASALLLLLTGLLDQNLLAALGAVAAAAVTGGLLAQDGGAKGRAASVVLWALAGAAAAHLTGGLTGPLAAWCLAPAAAGAAFRSRASLALGATLALAAAAVTALGGVILDLPTASAAAAPWLSLLALASITIGLAAGLLRFQGVTERETRRAVQADEVLELVGNQPLLLAATDRSGRVITAAGSAIGGFTPRDLAGRSLGHLCAETDLPALAEALHEAAHDGRATVYVSPAGGIDGWYEIALRATDGGRLVAAVRDAGEQLSRERRLEAERAVADQQNAGKSRFLANMSHELRTPLNAIMGFSDIMRQRLFGPLGDRYADYAELIHESGSHLLELINDVLDMSKIEAERFELAVETFDAREAVQAVLRLMRGQADRAGVNLRGVLPIQALEIDADRRAVKQICLNLISNALKFTPRGGSVTVTVQGDGDVLELVVSDTGVGIAHDDLERLGRPFEQAGDAEQRSAGSGLGLSLVRAFARLHGGEMTVESAVGEGTSVIVRMPVLTEHHVPSFQPVGKRQG